VTLTVATCQFPVDADPRSNARHVRRLLRAAKERGADVAHFCECSLSGYAGSDLPDLRGLDFPLLEDLAREIFALAGELAIWTLLGSTHRLGGRRKPHNSVYVVDPRGALVDRYDKRFCAGDRRSRTGDLAHYAPGDHPTVFEIAGVRCGVLICHDYRYPEVYRDYARRGVGLVFHSFHAGHVKPRVARAMRAGVGAHNLRWNAGASIPEITMPATSTAEAANNHLWISAANTCARESCFGSFVVRPDGVTTGRLPRHRTGLLLTSIDAREPFYDSTIAWRSRAMRGVLHSGTLVRSARSRRRTSL
jgi:deaminated glutathione amidase